MAEDDAAPRDEKDTRRKPRVTEPDPEVPPADGSRASRLSRLGRRLLDRGDDVRELASAVIETSDRAKTEMVRMVAREVRNYLDELKLKEDVMELVRNHSLELHVSINLKPLAIEGDEPAKPAAKAPPEPSDD